jgi:dihydroorotase
MVRRAKESGLDVTCEVTPHHLLLDESRLEGLDTNAKMYPPLRSAEDRLGLVAGLLDGTVDAVPPITPRTRPPTRTSHSRKRHAG